MELSFVIEAARRYAWLIALCAVLGAVPGLVNQRSATETFESRAVLLVVPARDARVQINVTGADERYVLGQLAVLRSDTLASRVAARIGGDTTNAEVRSSVDFIHGDDTDIVEIVAVSSDLERATLIADGYADSYLQSLADQLDPEGSPEIEELDQQLSALSERIADVDEQIAEAMAPFLNAATAPSSELTALPSIEQVAPRLVSERELLTADYLGRLAFRTDLALGSQVSVSTEIIERATTPQAPVAQRQALLIVAGALGGVLVGLFLATLFARLTPRLLSRRHAAETLGGQQVLGPLRWRLQQADGLLGVDTALNSEQQDVLTTIRSSLAMTPHSDRAMIVLVAGCTPGSGSEHVASSLASLWALEGYRTVLVGADLRRRGVTVATTTDSRQPIDDASPFSMEDELVETLTPNLVLLPASHGSAAARRKRIEHFLDEVDSMADVVVFDAGSLLGGTLRPELAESGDGVVLAIGADTNASTLALVARQLSGQRDRLTSVWTRPSSRRRSLGARRRPEPKHELPNDSDRNVDSEVLESVD